MTTSRGEPTGALCGLSTLLLKPSLVQQLRRLPELFEALGVPVHAAPGFEADDVLGTLARRCRERALVGDESDNLPGVRGVGGKTAAAWLSEHRASRASAGRGPSADRLSAWFGALEFRSLRDRLAASLG